MEKTMTLYVAADGTELEIVSSFALSPHATLLIWPCMGGCVLMYRCPVERFNDAGFSVIQFNPRGHGYSRGQFVPELVVEDLIKYISENKNDSSPLYVLGHSAGGNAALKFGTVTGSVDRFLLVSPVLDSIESLRYMYRIGTIMEFNMIAAALTSDSELLLSILENDRWMEPRVWEAEEYRRRIDDISGHFHVGSFLESLFIHGYNSFDDLKKQGYKSRIVLPLQDNWYPEKTVRAVAREAGAAVDILKGAKDHFFTGAWRAVWDLIFEEMARIYRKD